MTQHHLTRTRLLYQPAIKASLGRQIWIIPLLTTVILSATFAVAAPNTPPVGYPDEALVNDVKRSLGRLKSAEQITPEKLEQMRAQMPPGANVALLLPWTPETISRMDPQAALQSLQGRSLQLRTEGLIRANGRFDENESVVQWRELFNTVLPNQKAGEVFAKLTPALKDQFLMEQLQSIEAASKLVQKRVKYAGKPGPGRTIRQEDAERVLAAINGVTVVRTVVQPNLALFPAEDQTAGGVRKVLDQLKSETAQAQSLYDQQMTQFVAQRLDGLEPQVDKLEAHYKEHPEKRGSGFLSNDNLLRRWVHDVPTNYHSDRVMALRQRIDLLYTQAQGTSPTEQQPAATQRVSESPDGSKRTVQTETHEGKADARLGRAADVTRVFFQAVGSAPDKPAGRGRQARGGDKDYGPASQMVVEHPSLNVAKYIASLSRFAQPAPDLLAENVIGDCAVVMFAKPDAHSFPHAIYLIRQGGEWKIFPATANHVLNAEQRPRIHELNQWVKQFLRDPAAAAKTARPEMGSSSANEQPATERSGLPGSAPVAHAATADQIRNSWPRNSSKPQMMLTENRRRKRTKHPWRG